MRRDRRQQQQREQEREFGAQSVSGAARTSQSDLDDFLSFYFLTRP
jgi:hypothetical protein